MLDWLMGIAEIFGNFVKMLFELPFYGSVSYGYILLAVYVMALILIFLGGRFKK